MVTAMHRRCSDVKRPSATNVSVSGSGLNGLVNGPVTAREAEYGERAWVPPDVNSTIKAVTCETQIAALTVSRSDVGERRLGDACPNGNSFGVVLLVGGVEPWVMISR